MRSTTPVAPARNVQPSAAVTGADNGASSADSHATPPVSASRATERVGGQKNVPVGGDRRRQRVAFDGPRFIAVNEAVGDMRPSASDTITRVLVERGRRREIQRESLGPADGNRKGTAFLDRFLRCGRRRKAIVRASALQHIVVLRVLTPL